MKGKQKNANNQRNKAESIERGKLFIDNYLREYGNQTISSLSDAVTNSNQAKTVILRWMMRKAKISDERMARYLDCKPQSFRNKMVRDSFSFEDLIICAHACNCSIQIKNNSGETEEDVWVIDPEVFFKGSDSRKAPKDRVLSRLHSLDQEDLEEKQLAYEKLKEQLAQMQAEYGFK